MDKNSTLGKSQSIIFIIAFLIVLLITVGVQEAYEWNIEQITENSDWDNHPSLYKGTIAWSKQNPPRGLFYYDGEAIFELETGLENVGNKPSLYNGKITFAGWETWTGSSLGSQIYLYDNNTVSQISNCTVRVMY